MRLTNTEKIKVAPFVVVSEVGLKSFCTCHVIFLHVGAIW